MFVLRQISRNGKESEQNIVLGDYYSLCNRYQNPEGFGFLYEKLFGSTPGEFQPEEKFTSEHNIESSCYAILAFRDRDPYPLFTRDWNYIMTGDGKTFENISFR